MTRIRSLLRAYPTVAVTLLVLIVVLILNLCAWLLPEPGLGTAAFWLATGYVLVIIVTTAIDMLRDMFRGHFGLDILALVAMSAALAVGEYLAALIVVLMLTGGEALEQYAAARAKRDLTNLLERAPQIAHRLDPAHPEALPEDIAVGDVAPGDELLLKPSEIVPVDGELLSDRAEFDESSLTGESLPVLRNRGDAVFSGTLNGDHAVTLRATATAAQSQYQQILDLVRDAEETKAPTVRLADRYALPFTIVSLVIAALAWWVSGDPVRFAAVLVLATPCPLLIAAPVAFIGGMSAAARDGIIVKGGATLEALAKLRTVAFDKTGTLSHGDPELIRVLPAAGFSATELIRLAASAEQYSSHVLASGVIDAAISRGLPLAAATDATEIATQGVAAMVEGTPVRVGKLSFIQEVDPVAESVALSSGETSVAIAVGDRFAGTLILADALRENAPATVTALRDLGVETVLMVTGDNEDTARELAAQAGISDVHANLHPQDKVRIIQELPHRPVLMVGDGLNDAPVLATAEVGVAMGARGATAASESADAVILRDDIGLVVRAIEVGKHTVAVAVSAIWLGIALSLCLMLIAAFGYIMPVAGALIQELVDLAAILFALRARTGGKARSGVQQQGRHDDHRHRQHRSHQHRLARE